MCDDAFNGDPTSLDAYEIQNDQQATICHRTPGLWALITVSTQDCLLHLDQHQGSDAFPSAICRS